MVYITMAVCLAYGIAFVGVSVFQCWPISGAWTNWDGTFKGHCNSINLQGWTSAAINIVLDLVVIILPLPELWKMQMSTQKKLSIISMVSSNSENPFHTEHYRASQSNHYSLLHLVCSMLPQTRSVCFSVT